LVVVGVVVAWAAVAPGASAGAGFNTPGNILIADQFNNRVIEVTRAHQVVWSFGNGSHVAGPHSIVAPNDVERVGALTLIAGTGAPAAPSATEPACQKNGCADNRVILVNQAGKIVWQYGKAGASGSGPDQLNTPVFAAGLPNRHVLIVDQSNERVIEVDSGHHIVWQYGTTGKSGAGRNHLNNPNSAELLANGDILIADENNNRVIEVTRAHKIVWQYGSPSNSKLLSGAAFASRLPNGNTLITDSGNGRVIEITPGKKVVWSYSTVKRHGSTSMPLPTRAVRLKNGNTLISDQFNDQVIEVTHTDHPKIVFVQGGLGVAGKSFNKCNAPYDAKVVGDYTGLTLPTGF